MDIQTLRLFTHLAKGLHFGRTSRACNISPSALTRTIQRLEAELGEQLFFRDNRSVSLTQAGEYFRAYAEDVLQRREQLQLQFASNRELKGSVSLYCSVTAAYSVLPDIFQRFRRGYPQVHLKLQTGDAAAALPRLQNRETDIVIAALPEKLPGRIIFLELTETPLVFIAPTDYPGTVCHSTNSEQEIDWLQTPFIMPDTGLSRRRVDQWFAEKKITPHIYAEVAGNEAIIAMVSLGCGIGVVPLLVLDKSPVRKQIKILACSPPLVPFSIAVCTIDKKIRSPQVQAFWNIATSIENAYKKGPTPHMKNGVSKN
ncbi:MAG: HTH-type transcriptional activator IlvY [Candidatus Electrothrix sp. GW3-4]|uniref:HTH-type transcriptional activator IlvY n=1 Tax=Candidatus Electrothrix sp. GW3-4 TaxID=3126740 RepID=UPI0030CA7D93